MRRNRQHETARYAMTREVAAFQPVFPLSMSDFKPGDKEYWLRWQTFAAASLSGTSSRRSCIVLRRRFRTLSRTRSLNPQVSGFLTAGRETPGSVYGFGVARQLHY